MFGLINISRYFDCRTVLLLRIYVYAVNHLDDDDDVLRSHKNIDKQRQVRLTVTLANNRLNWKDSEDKNMIAVFCAYVCFYVCIPNCRIKTK